MTRILFFLSIAALFTGCAAPCKTVGAMSAYEEALDQCVRWAYPRANGLRCIADVEARYLAKFAELGIDAAETLDELNREAEAAK